MNRILNKFFEGLIFSFIVFVLFIGLGGCEKGQVSPELEDQIEGGVQDQGDDQAEDQDGSAGTDEVSGKLIKQLKDEVSLVPASGIINNDINGNGYPDIIVLGNNEEKGDMLYAFDGSSLSGAINVEDAFATLTVPEEFAIFYLLKISICGDVNGDNKADIMVVTSRSTDVPYVHEQQVYIFSGASFSDTVSFDDALATISGDPSIEYNAFGSTLTGIGDIDSDSKDDIIISDYSAADGSGVAYVFSGASIDGELNTDDAIAKITGKADSSFGRNIVTNIEDVNSDGFSDVLISTHKVHNDDGAVYIFSGADLVGEITYEEALCTIKGSGGKEFGIYAAKAGDVNADGIPDIMVGDDRNSEMGHVYVFSGEKFRDCDSENADAFALAQIFGEDENEHLGFGMLSLGDINEDGYDDVMVAAPFKEEGKPDLFIFSGSDLSGELLEAAALISLEPLYSASQRKMSRVGDLNGDGISEILLGTYQDPILGDQFAVYNGADLNGSRELIAVISGKDIDWSRAAGEL